jgi:hypothetical protein
VYAKNEDKGWLEFYRCVERQKGNRECTVVMKGVTEQIIADFIEKANSQNFYYSSVFSFECSISQIQCANSYETFAISTTIIQ